MRTAELDKELHDRDEAGTALAEQKAMTQQSKLAQKDQEIANCRVKSKTLIQKNRTR